MPAGTCTDDGQMSVATAQGILEWRRTCGQDPAIEMASTDLEALSLAIHKRYLESTESGEHVGRAAGINAMAALRAGRPGLPADRVNPGYKGCGGVMRVAPLGLDERRHRSARGGGRDPRRGQRRRPPR